VCVFVCVCLFVCVCICVCVCVCVCVLDFKTKKRDYSRIKSSTTSFGVGRREIKQEKVV